MKFQCDRCKTRYSIADDKVRGKILKIRCKTCEAVITVRDGDADPQAKLVPDAAPRAASISTAGGKAKVRPAAKTIELPSVTGSMAAVLPPAPATPPPSAPAPDEGEWYLSVDGEQDGPLSAEEAQRRVARKAAGVEMFAWRDDFTDWIPVEDVPVLAVHLQKRMPPPPPRRPSGVGVGTGSSPSLSPAAFRANPIVQVGAGAGASAPKNNGVAARASGTPEPTPEPVPDPTLINDPFEVASRSTPSAASRNDGDGDGDGLEGETPPPPPDDSFDFNIGEASRVVKLPILAPALAASLRSQSDSLPPVSARSSGPAIASSSLPGVGLTDAAPATTVPRKQAESLQLPIVDRDASRMMTAQPAPPMTQAFPTPVRQRKLGVPLALGGIAVVAVLCAVVFISRSGADKVNAAAAAGEGNSDNVLIDNFYRKDNPLLNEASRPEPTGVQLPPAAPQIVPRGTRPVSKPGSAAGVVATAAPVRQEPARIAPTAGTTPQKPSGKQDTFDDDAASSESLTPDDVRNTYAANEVGLKRCYERALKSDPTTSIAKMPVKITISPKGNVSDISVPDKSDLSSCVSSSIRSWRFRKSNGEFTTEFTVFFAKRG